MISRIKGGIFIMTLKDYPYEIGILYDSETKKEFNLEFNSIGINDLEEYIRLIGRLDRKFTSQRVWYYDRESENKSYITLTISIKADKEPNGGVPSIGLVNTAPTYIPSKELIDILSDKDEWI